MKLKTGNGIISRNIPSCNYHTWVLMHKKTFISRANGSFRRKRKLSFLFNLIGTLYLKTYKIVSCALINFLVYVSSLCNKKQTDKRIFVQVFYFTEQKYNMNKKYGAPYPTLLENWNLSLHFMTSSGIRHTHTCTRKFIYKTHKTHSTIRYKDKTKQTTKRRKIYSEQQK